MVGAVDRRELAKTQPVKENRWPRTDRRHARIATVLTRRQPDLTIVLENVHDPHNISAVLRSCDGVGVLRVHLVYSLEAPPAKAFARTTSAGSAKWIEVHLHDSMPSCYAVLRAEGFSVLATALTAQSTDLYATNLRSPMAIVFGNEMRGLSVEAIEAADGAVSIPMMGMVQSLNISVACAVVLYEALRQRRLAGDYDHPKLNDDARDAKGAEWLKR
jgi:tRNA (guanosine-2'-O-)-methyltransferase